MIDEAISLGALRARIVALLPGVEVDAMDAPHRAALLALAEQPPVECVIGYLRAAWAAYDGDQLMTTDMLERLVEAAALTMRFRFHGAQAEASSIRDAIRAALSGEP